MFRLSVGLLLVGARFLQQRPLTLELLANGHSVIALFTSSSMAQDVFSVDLNRCFIFHFDIFVFTVHAFVDCVIFSLVEPR